MLVKEPNYDGSKANRLKEGLAASYMNANGSKELLNLLHSLKKTPKTKPTQTKNAAVILSILCIFFLCLFPPFSPEIIYLLNEVVRINLLSLRASQTTGSLSHCLLNTRGLLKLCYLECHISL